MSWTVRGFLPHQCFVFWLLTFLLNVSHTSSNESTVFWTCHNWILSNFSIHCSFMQYYWCRIKRDFQWLFFHETYILHKIIANKHTFFNTKHVSHPLTTCCVGDRILDGPACPHSSTNKKRKLSRLILAKWAHIFLWLSPRGQGCLL